MVLGHPITFVLHPAFKKYSANKQALVLESSPPITTSPSRFSFFTFFKAFSNYSGVSILSLPLLIISNPPLFKLNNANFIIKNNVMFDNIYILF